jgi:hypothetical protein
MMLRSSGTVSSGHLHVSVTLFPEKRLSIPILNDSGPKMEKVTGLWTKLHNEELNNLYTSRLIIRVNKLKKMRWPAHVTLMWEVRNVCKILVVKSEETRPIG